MSGGPVEEYLADLAAHLRTRGRRRRRILAEVEDHLRSAATARGGTDGPAGAAEHEAVLVFGPADALAHRLDADAVAPSSRSAAALATLATLAVCGLTALVSARSPAWSPPAYWLEPWAGGVVALAAQVAAVAAAVAVLRAWRWRGEPTVPAAASAGVARASLLAAGAAAVGVADAATVVLTHTGRLHSADAVAVAVAVGAGLVTAIAGLAAGVRSRLVCARVAPGAAAPDAALDDLAVLATRLTVTTARHIPFAGRMGETLQASARRHPRLATFVDLRQHPWRACLALATMALVATSLLGLLNLFRTGDADPSPVVGLAEALAILAAWAALGPVLELRRRR